MSLDDVEKLSESDKSQPDIKLQYKKLSQRGMARHGRSATPFQIIVQAFSCFCA